VIDDGPCVVVLFTYVCVCVEHASHTLTKIHSRHGDHDRRSRSLTHGVFVSKIQEKNNTM